MTASQLCFLAPLPQNYHYPDASDHLNRQRAYVSPTCNSLSTDLRDMNNIYNDPGYGLQQQQRSMLGRVDNSASTYDSHVIPGSFYSPAPQQQAWHMDPEHFSSSNSGEATASLADTGYYDVNNIRWPSAPSYNPHPEIELVHPSNPFPGYPTASPAAITALPLSYTAENPLYQSNSTSDQHQQLSSSPDSVTISVSPTPPAQFASIPDSSPSSPPSRKYTYTQEYQLFVNAMSLPAVNAGPFIPQTIYKPHTNSDRKRYVEEVSLEGPLYFAMQQPSEFGIPLSDALHSRVKRLADREQPVFEGRGPSVSVRLEWPGYRQWTRQIPTKDFRSPPGPITMAKLAKNIAKCVQRFIDENKDRNLEEPANRRWKVGVRPNELKLDDLVLVSLHHVSLGSWQPHLRLRRPLQ